jgi:IS5 family transposase
MAITRSVIRDAQSALESAKAVLESKRRAAYPPLEVSIRALETFIPRAWSVVRQTRARIIRGITKSKDKLISIFEPHAQILRRGKPHKPTEFGLLVKIQESDGGLVTDVGEVPGKADAPLLEPSIERHVAVFGHAPRVAATDRGFYSDEGVAALTRMGVTTAAIPKPG